jgi:PAS domain S-box-containing protein
MKAKIKFESLVFMVFGILSLLTLFYTHNMWIDLFNNNKAQTNNLSRAQIDITQAHLWFEELIGGDTAVNIERDVWRNIDNTESFLKQLLNGGINAQGLTLTAISDTESRKSLEQIGLHLTKFKGIALQRLNSKNNGQPGSTLNKHFDDTFNEIIISIRSLDNKQLQIFNTDDHNQKIQYHLVSLILLIIMLLFIFKLDQSTNEEKLLTEELTQFIYTANAAIFGIDTQGKVNQWNQKSAEITGYQFDEVRGKDLVEKCITADYRESVNDVLQKALKGEETSNLEFPLYTKDNNLVMVLLNATTRRSVNGDIIGVVGVGQDITELDSYRTKMEKKVKERTFELDTILSLSPDGFLFSNADKNIVYISPALLDMTGFKAELFIGKSTQFFSESMEGLFDLDHPNDQAFVGNKDGEHLIYLLNPVLRIINCNQRTMVGLKGEIEGEVLYFRDVTHDTEVKNMKNDFLSTAAHELRTPLASICGFSELLINRDYDKKESLEMIEIIHRQSLNLKLLLDDLLDLSRIESRAGKDFHMMKNSLKELVNKSCVEVEGAFRGRKVEIQSLENWPIISFDSYKIHQVFNNLLSNAFKYSPEDKGVLLKTSEREKDGNKQFGVSIIDHGIGMTPQQLARLGERFYRVDDSGSIPGTGLGVSLVKEIVSIHGGDIEFTSDKGMVVTVWLPMDKNKYTEE